MPTCLNHIRKYLEIRKCQTNSFFNPLVNTQASSNTYLQTQSNQQIMTQNQSIMSIRSDIEKIRRDIFTRRQTQLERGEILKQLNSNSQENLNLKSLTQKKKLQLRLNEPNPYQQVQFQSQLLASLPQTVQNIKHKAQKYQPKKRIKIYQTQHQELDNGVIMITADNEEFDNKDPYFNIQQNPQFLPSKGKQANQASRYFNQYMQTESSYFPTQGAESVQTSLQNEEEKSQQFIKQQRHIDEYQIEDQENMEPQSYPRPSPKHNKSGKKIRKIKIRRANRGQFNNNKIGQIEINSISSFANGYQSAKNSSSIVSFRTDQLIKKSQTPLYCCRGFKQCAIF
ncbi:UNKNOWN [Stylonychia lemnae]|uniref:Uncharacterized protein n=1 Tax=Stylonychia lemnae TaxID=5949 RepID=A0A077ZNJ9_STYLE|nr:UNKNOWN [Stylonychia lemnae]|eukprot:CDW71488.1 UNKNOWN [Stylonychia lemnae]